MSVLIRFSRRERGVAVIEPKPLPESFISLLDRFYESYGVQDAAWIRQVDEHNRFIVVLPPTYYVPVDIDTAEVVWPEWL
jgi:hypothetical protein